MLKRILIAAATYALQIALEILRGIGTTAAAPITAARKTQRQTHTARTKQAPSRKENVT